MRVTGQVIEVEAVISSLLNDDRGWTVWHDDRGKRQLHVPTFMAVHIPSRIIIGVYCRPRRLYPSELPAVGWLPATVQAVVWWPALAAEIRAWLANPDGREPPGVLLTTRGGVK